MMRSKQGQAVMLTRIQKVGNGEEYSKWPFDKLKAILRAQNSTKSKWLAMSPSTWLGILSLSKDSEKGHPRKRCAP